MKLLTVPTLGRTTLSMSAHMSFIISFLLFVSAGGATFAHASEPRGEVSTRTRAAQPQNSEATTGSSMVTGNKTKIIPVPNLDWFHKQNGLKPLDSAQKQLLKQNGSRIGNEGGHGGDTYALEFFTLAKRLEKQMLSEEVRDRSVFAKWNISSVGFSEAIKATWLVSAEGASVRLNGAEVDAINSQGSAKEFQGHAYRILINRTRWRESSLRQKLSLVLHEYFGVAGIELDRFDASVDFAGLIRATAATIERAGDSGLIENVFYGRAITPAGLSQANPCTEAAKSALIAKATAAAMQKCSFEKANCRIHTANVEVVLSQETLGFRYCESLVTAR